MASAEVEAGRPPARAAVTARAVSRALARAARLICAWLQQAVMEARSWEPAIQMKAVVGTKGCLWRADSLHGEETTRFMLKWPPKTPCWEVHVAVPRNEPSTASLQGLPLEQRAVIGLLAVQGGEWLRKLGPYAGQVDAFKSCFSVLFPCTLTSKRSFLRAFEDMSQRKSVVPTDRVRVLSSSQVVVQRDAAKDAAKKAVRKTLEVLKVSVAQQYAFVGTKSGVLKLWRSATLAERGDGDRRRKGVKVHGVALKPVSEKQLDAAIYDAVYVQGGAPQRIPLQLVMVNGRARAIEIPPGAAGVTKHAAGSMSSRGKAVSMEELFAVEGCTRELAERVGVDTAEEKTLVAAQKLGLVRYRLASSRDAGVLELVALATQRLGTVVHPTTSVLCVPD